MTATARRSSRLRLALCCLPLLLLAACATPVGDAQKLTQAGQYDAALDLLLKAQAERPDDLAIRTAIKKQREIIVASLVAQADGARTAGRLAEMPALISRIEAVSPNHPRARWLREDLQRTQRHARMLAQARTLLKGRQPEQAQPLLRQVLDEDPGNTAARGLIAQIAEQRAEAMRELPLLAAADKPVTLEFREAPLRTVFEALARAAGVNFVFDKDVRPDSRVTLFLRDTTVEEAMRVILATQQLERKLLNDNSVLIYPNTAQKQREHQELVTRSFYLVNADVKQVQTLVRTMAKTRDVYVDERLNLLVVRDAPEVVRMVERLVAQVDIVEPEVMLEVEVMEISSNRMAELGLSWPSSFGYGLVPGTTGSTTYVTSADTKNFTTFIANPALSASLTGTSGASNLLANPKIRARNREKAKIQIGEKLPVFTTTSTANVGVSASVSYIDVGLKLDVEPQVQLDNDVIIKVGLEVSNLISQVKGPQDAIAYRVGTRNFTTSLRLKDGETQILAGLINDEDRKAASGIPYLHEAPVLGRLFGVQTDTRDKTEIVLLITPRVVRNLELPPSAASDQAGGTDSAPGSASLRVNRKARVQTQPGGGRSAGPAGAPYSPPLSQPGGATQAPAKAEPSISGPDEVAAGLGFQVTVLNPGTQPLASTLQFDSALFDCKDAGCNGPQLPVQVEAGGSRSYSFSAKADVPTTVTAISLAAGGQSLTITVRDNQGPPAGEPEPGPDQ
ncbi:MAG: general secretion pathway protein GspD [Aquabacterium sp.]|nr:MAG: general secretion pathway protein GspD [Aquabacterium sp.]